jgi:hypothetical protein
MLNVWLKLDAGNHRDFTAREPLLSEDLAPHSKMRPGEVLAGMKPYKVEDVCYLHLPWQACRFRVPIFSIAP